MTFSALDMQQGFYVQRLPARGGQSGTWLWQALCCHSQLAVNFANQLRVTTPETTSYAPNIFRRLPVR